MIIGRGFESTPLMLDGVLYITGNNNYGWAATPDRAVGRHRRVLPPALTYGGSNPSNRGFAASGDLVYMGTLDAHLIAFNRNTGDIAWDVVVDDHRQGHAILGAPLVVKDKVITGNSAR